MHRLWNIIYIYYNFKLVILRRDDDMLELSSPSTLIEGIGCDGGGVGGDGHIRTTAAGGAAAVHSPYIQTTFQPNSAP